MKKAAGAYPEAHAAAVVGNGPVNLLAMLAHGVESTTNPIWITDLEDRFIFVNRSFLRTYGHTEKEVLGKHLATLFSPANPPTLLPEILEKTRHGGWRGEALHRHNNGLEFPVFLNTSKIKSRTGEIIGLMGVAEDITAHRYTESHIHLLANAVESTEEMISITDCDDRFTFVNKAFQKKYGYTQAEAWGRTPEFLRSPSTSPSTSKEIRRETLKGGWRGELMNRRKDGTDFPIHLSTSAIKNRKGETVGLVGVARDITEHKLAERRSATFSRLGAELGAATTVEGTARIILEAASYLFSWDSAFVHLYDAEKDELVPVLTFDTRDERRLEIPPEQVNRIVTPLARRVMTHGAQLLNPGDQLEIKLRPFGMENQQTASRMFVPLRKGAKFIGILSAQSYTPNAYLRAHLLDFQTLADYGSGVLQRITAQNALRDSEERFRTLFESAPIAIALHDADGRIIETNRSYDHMVGHTAAEIRKLGVKHLTHPEDVDEGIRLFEDLATGKRDRYRREKRFYRKDGTEIWAISFNSAIRSPDGKLRYIISLVEDITERKLAESARQELASIVETSEDAIFSETLEGKLTSWNQSAERIFGFRAAEAIGQSVTIIVPPEALKELGRIMERLRSGKRVEEFETVCRRKDGSLIEVSVTASPIKDLHGQVTAASAIVRDITERKRLEKEIMQIGNNERRRIGYELHDGLGQVLTGIAFKARALQERIAITAPAQAAEFEEIVNLINGAISQTRRLAHGLDPIEVESAGIVAALGNLASEARNLFGIECDFDCTEHDLELNDQASLALYRITQEAIRNAHIHGGAQQVRIKLSRISGRLRLNVKDDGKGFGPRPPGTTGMGLRIMQHRARSIGGELDIASRPGHGTAVECSVPLELCLQPSRKPS